MSAQGSEKFENPMEDVAGGASDDEKPDKADDDGGILAHLGFTTAGLTHYQQFVSKVDGMVTLELQDSDTGKPAMKRLPTMLIGIVCLSTFALSFLHTCIVYFGDCNEANGCVSCGIIDKNTNNDLTTCTPTVAPSLDINAGCLSFAILNNYSEIDQCIGKSAFQKQGWGASWKATGNLTHDVFHNSLAAHREIWDCFTPNDLHQVQDPNVDCVRAWTTKYHAGLSDRLYTYDNDPSKVTDNAMKAFGIKLFSSLFSMSAAMSSSADLIEQGGTGCGKGGDADDDDEGTGRRRLQENDQPAPPPGSMWMCSKKGTVKIGFGGYNINSLAGHIGTADPSLSPANNNMGDLQLYIPANYIAIASQWYEGKSATWNDDRFKAIETHFQETEEYPSWQKEPWMLADFPKDAVHTLEMLFSFEQDTEPEANTNAKKTRHCGDSSVFVGSKSSFANGLYKCCTHKSTNQKLAEAQALAGFYLMVVSWIVTLVAYPIRHLLAYRVPEGEGSTE